MDDYNFKHYLVKKTLSCISFTFFSLSYQIVWKMLQINVVSVHYWVRWKFDLYEIMLLLKFTYSRVQRHSSRLLLHPEKLRLWKIFFADIVYFLNVWSWGSCFSIALMNNAQEEIEFFFWFIIQNVLFIQQSGETLFGVDSLLDLTISLHPFNVWYGIFYFLSVHLGRKTLHFLLFLQVFFLFSRSSRSKNSKGPHKGRAQLENCQATLYNLNLFQFEN